MLRLSPVRPACRRGEQSGSSAQDNSTSRKVTGVGLGSGICKAAVEGVRMLDMPRRLSRGSGC